jgi:putative Holliday junction resolvase
MIKLFGSKESQQAEEILLGIDHGGSNIGLAFGRRRFASPLKVISAKNTDEAIKEISRVAIENKVTKIIVGLPLTADNKETQQSQEVRKFVKLLSAHLKFPTEFVNELNTSKEAMKGAISSGISQKNRRKIDDISAAIVLNRYYEEHEG